MFTGIVQEQGTLVSRQDLGSDARLEIEIPGALSGRLQTGDSLAVNGVCLTVAGDRGEGHLLFDVSAETLSRTRFGTLEAGTVLNLEPAMSASDPVGGHFVTGHVDGLGEVVSVEEEGRSRRVEVEAPESLARYIAAKGCITVDGVSLTVNEVHGNRFGFNVVPHTLSVTNMREYQPGIRVHLEVDLIARYLERLTGDRETPPEEESITADFLTRQGFEPPMTAEEDSAGHEADDEPRDDSLGEPGPA